MTTHLVSYATATHHKGQERLNRSARRFGIDRCHTFSEAELRRTDFYRQHQAILAQARGAGYRLWKPYLILTVMLEAQEGEVIVYSDSGAEIVDSLEPLIEICRQRGVMLFQAGDDCGSFTVSQWSKRDCLLLMSADTPAYHHAPLVAGSPLLVVNNAANQALIAEWLAYCADPRVLTDQANTRGLRNYPEFYDHRHDQSVLSILCHKYGWATFRDPSQYGDRLKMAPFRRAGELPAGAGYAAEPLANSPYGTLFNRHGQKNFSLTSKLANLIDKLPLSAPSPTPAADQGPLSLTIGITTFAARFEQYFIPLLKAIRELDQESEIVVAINGEHEREFDEGYRREILAFLATQKRVFPVMFPRFRGVAKLWNTIVVHATKEYILMLNDDIMVNGAGLFEEIKRTIRANHYRSFTINQSWSHFLLSRTEIDHLGYFDERLLGIGEEDGDLSWRYFHEYRQGVANFRIKGIRNMAEETVYTYKPTNITGHSGTKYSLFNRTFFQQKYTPDRYGSPNMSGEPVQLTDPGPEQYPNERFYRTRKTEL